MKHFFLFVCSVFLANFVFGQSTVPTEKTLLWRITGKGLQKPSYLYGTMHLTDERVFNLSDSLLFAIEKSEGFAMEVDPDEMMTVMMEEMLNDIKKSRFLKDVVSRKAYNKYGPMLSKRIHKDIDDITVKDVVQEQNRWMQDAYSKGTMPTFLDTWLYDVARKQGKWVGGIEDIEDQTGIMDDLFNEQDLEFLTVDYSSYGKKFLDEMIENYVLQDIATIEKMSTGDDANRKDILLLRRNLKMATRMDSLSAIRSMVFAVGAAHLPGDSGLVDLLRKKGFVVEPVFSDKKIVAKNYKVEAKPTPWYKASDSKGYYDVELPGKASPLKMYGFYEMLAHVNLFNSASFMVMAIPTAIDKENADRKLLDLARKITSNKSLKQGKSIYKDGMPGREYFSKTRNGNEQIQLFYSNNTVYLAAVLFLKETDLSSADATHFFSSLVLHQKEQRADGMISFGGKFPGIEGETPVALEWNKELTAQANEDGFITGMYTGLDEKTGSVYMLSVKNTVDNSFLPNDSSYLQTMRTNMRSRLDEIDYDSIILDADHYQLEQKGKQKEPNIYFHLKSYVYGNRVYSLVAVLPDNAVNRAMADNVMSGFNVIPVLSMGWDTMQVEQGYMSTWGPVPFKKIAEDTTEVNDSDIETFVSKDSITSHAFFVMRSAFAEEDWYSSEEEYWEQKLESFASYSDSIYSKMPFSKDGISGYDIEVRKKLISNKAKYYRLFLYGDTLYTLFTSLPLSLKDDADSKRFFTDFSISQPAAAPTIFTSKASMLLTALSSTDSARRSKAYNNISNANFVAADIPLIREAMLKHYDWDTSYLYYSTVQTVLGARLTNLSDSTLDAFIKENYTYGQRDDEEQSALLAILLESPKRANMRFALDGFQKFNDSSEIYSMALYLLDDSLALAKQFTPDIIALVKKPQMANVLLGVLNRMMDSSAISRSDLLPYEDDIINYGNKEIDNNSEDEDSHYWIFRNLAVTAGKLNTEKSKGLLKKMLRFKNKYVLEYAVDAMLESNLDIPAAALDSLAAAPRFRMSLWEELQKKQRTNLFPAKWATQQYFAEASIYSNLEDDYEFNATTDLGSKKASINGKDVIVYFFKIDMGYEDEMESYLACSAFAAKEKSFTPLVGMVDMYWDNEYDPRQKAKQINSLIKQLSDRSNTED